MFLEILQNSQENLCAGVSFLIKLQAWGLLKDRLWHRCFPVNFAKFLRTSFLTEHLWWLLLNRIKKNSRTDKENYFQTSQNILEQKKNITDQSEYSRADKEIIAVRILPYIKDRWKIDLKTTLWFFSWFYRNIRVVFEKVTTLNTVYLLWLKTGSVLIIH